METARKYGNTYNNHSLEIIRQEPRISSTHSYLDIIILFYLLFLFTGPTCCITIWLSRPHLLGSRMSYGSQNAPTRLEYTRHQPNYVLKYFKNLVLLWTSQNKKEGTFSTKKMNYLKITCHKWVVIDSYQYFILTSEIYWTLFLQGFAVKPHVQCLPQATPSGISRLSINITDASVNL